MDDFLTAALSRGLHSAEMGELLHLLKHVGHAVKETVDDLLEPDEEGKRR